MICTVSYVNICEITLFQALNELEPSDDEYSLDDVSPTLSANYYVKR